MGPIKRSDAPRLAKPADQLEIAMHVFGLAPFADPLGESSRSEVGAELLIVDDPPQGQKQFAVGAVSQAAAAQNAGLSQSAPASCTTTGVPTAKASSTT